MAEFSAEALRALAADAEAAERAAEEMASAAASSAEVAGLPDLCGIYRSTLRGPLEVVRRVVCSPFLRPFIGSGPCRILEQVISTLDGLCPG